MYIGDEYMLKFSIIGAIEPDVIVLISVISAIFVGVFTVSLVRYLKNKKIRAEEANREVEEVDVKKGIRYTEDATIIDKTGEMNVKKFCFAAGLRSSITWDAYAIGLDDDKELVWEMFLGRNKMAKLTHSGILCSFILKNSELKDFIKHVVDGQMKDYMSAVREVRKVQVKQTASEWKC
jgi:hypothetical protein